MIQTLVSLKKLLFSMLSLSLVLLWHAPISAQNCAIQLSKKDLKEYQKSWELFQQKDFGGASELMFQVSKTNPDYAQAQMSLGIFYIENPRPNIKTARKYLEKSVELCADSVLYSHFYLGKIYYGNRQFEKAIACFEHFLKDVDLIKSDDDYFEIKNYLEYSRVSQELLSHPVPFEPVVVPGISTASDEYLPIISPDNEFALFTRRQKQYITRGLVEEMVEKEVFTYSLRNSEGIFEQGWDMDAPFNRVENEGAATLTIDNYDLYYTVCTRDPKTKYLNCDLYHSQFRDGNWSKIEGLGEHINGSDSWESQPSVTSDGSRIYFASNRIGGLGGYDIYLITRNNDGKWSNPENVGASINTPGNEKSPFIHTDSQTLYFSSDGHKGLGGYDIFFSRFNEQNEWQKPTNIGYPINSFDDDLGFFVSTDGQYGYYASNRIDENNNWNLYTFPLYPEARPQKVLFIKGTVDVGENPEPIRAKVQLKNLRTKAVTEIPVDTNTGKYVAAILFKDNQLLTVKNDGYIFSSRLLSTEDTTLNEPKKMDIVMKEIKVGHSYKIDDINFITNSAELSADAKKIIDEFATFLTENPSIEIEIQGHTDNVGNDQTNMDLSDKRARSVYTWLIEKGIASSRLASRGYGETQPIASNETLDGRAQNRRTVFLIKK
jgi:outer membrane protein OmpA-like peptidoglycan-associated protein